jgi:AraC-like DNA-binding protein
LISNQQRYKTGYNQGDSLEKTSRGVADIAADVGYESESAFNRAFKREFGQPPGRYRSGHKSSHTTKASEHLEARATFDR